MMLVSMNKDALQLLEEYIIENPRVLWTVD